MRGAGGAGGAAGAGGVVGAAGAEGARGAGGAGRAGGAGAGGAGGRAWISGYGAAAARCMTFLAIIIINDMVAKDRNKWAAEEGKFSAAVSRCAWAPGRLAANAKSKHTVLRKSARCIILCTLIGAGVSSGRASASVCVALFCTRGFRVCIAPFLVSCLR